MSETRIVGRYARTPRAWMCSLCLSMFVVLGFAACASIPKGRYGVDELVVEGAEDLDPFALKACLATKERASLSIDLSKNPSPTCNKPPFDARRLHLSLWRWPWTDWPLYDPSVFERDVTRVERWYRARGYYGVRILDVSAEPEQVLFGSVATEDNNEVALRIRIEEGEPVTISSVAIDGVDTLEEDVGSQVLGQLDEIEPGDRFDEALFDKTKEKLLRTLRNAGYASAVVQGEVKITPKEHSAELRYRAVPGPFSELGDVCIEGYGKLPPRLILEASDLLPGAAYSQSELEDARTRIYQMRVFAEVEIVTGRVDPRTGSAQFEEERTQREGEWLAWQNQDGEENPRVIGPRDEPEEGPTERVCRLSRRDSVRPKIPIEIRVKPSKLYRFGVGTGIQIGVEDGQRPYSAAQQWDVHVFTYLELKNFLGGLRRFRIEERPKLVFPNSFPKTEPAEPGQKIALGNNLSALLEWPAFLENRTLLRITSAWDRGPDPFGGSFIRDDVNVGLGPSRGFLQNRLNASATIHVNPYLPKVEKDRPEIQVEGYLQLYLQQTLEWDRRDDRTSPTRGVYARIELQETLPPSDWRYLRLTPEVRRYMSLPYGLVLAGRAGVGLLRIYSAEATKDGLPRPDELLRLGPRPYRLRGGGPYSVRGVQAGQLGLRSSDIDENGNVVGFPGGTRSWIASLELRIPLGTNFGVATFLDCGDVDGGEGKRKAEFRFDHPNTTFGAGLRYKTLVGPVRLDVGWLVPGLQGDTSDSSTVNKRDPLFKLKGAVHLTIGEAF